MSAEAVRHHAWQEAQHKRDGLRPSKVHYVSTVCICAFANVATL